MIVEVNNLTSSTAANASRHSAEADPTSLRLAGKVNQSSKDPVADIVAILNAHLGSLKWIDSNASQLREKVENLRRGQVGAGSNGDPRSSTGVGSLRKSEGRANSPATVRHRGESVAPSSASGRDRQSSVGPDSVRAGSVGPGYNRAGSLGRSAGAGWSEATVAMGSGSNLGRSRGYGL